MPEDKAKTFPLKNYPVQFELMSSTSENKTSVERIEDIFNLHDSEQYSKVLLKGMRF